MYYFSQRASNSPWPLWTGAMHADEIAFVFGFPLNRSRGYDEAEIRLAKKMMTYWANFAKTGYVMSCKLPPLQSVKLWIIPQATLSQSLHTDNLSHLNKTYTVVSHNSPLCCSNPSLSADHTWTETYWPLHTPLKRETLHLNARNNRYSLSLLALKDHEDYQSIFSIMEGIRVKQCAFWRKFLPQLGEWWLLTDWLTD